MTRLLVSVRDVEEARIALESGADLIDIKEPRNGSLGAAEPITISGVITQFGKHIPVSVALGELLDDGLSERLPTVYGAQFAKIGLADCAAVADWESRWQANLESLPPGTQPVGVVYADFERAASPPAIDIIRLASQLGCAAVLVDTFDKSSGSLTGIWDRDGIRSFVLEVQRLGMLAVLAGTLSESDIANLLPLRPDIFAVRGAACRTTRTSSIDGEKISRLKELLADWKEPGCHDGTLKLLA